MMHFIAAGVGPNCPIVQRRVWNIKDPQKKATLVNSTNPIRIRPYENDDWQRMCVIHDSARMDELRLSVGVAAFRSLEETYQDEGLFDDQLLIAEIEGIVVGFVAFDTEEVTWLYVAPDCYRKGIGRMLLRSALTYGEESKRVEVLEGNAPALHLYISEGFEITERRKGQLVGNETFAAQGIVLQKTR